MISKLSCATSPSKPYLPCMVPFHIPSVESPSVTHFINLNSESCPPCFDSILFQFLSIRSSYVSSNVLKRSSSFILFSSSFDTPTPTLHPLSINRGGVGDWSVSTQHRIS